MKSTGN